MPDASFGEQLGQQMAQQTANGILGIAVGGYNDRRQLKMQGKLQDMQIRGNKEMTDYNWQKQLDMWNATSYPAQIKNMKAANVNPAMLYGLGGGGGATNSIQTGNVQGADAPKGGGEIPAMVGLGLQTAAQVALLKAQKQNVEADTKLKEANATKTAGVDTMEATARTGNIVQSTDNLKAQKALTEVQTRLNQIEESIRTASKEDVLSQITAAAIEANNQADIIARNNWLDKATLNDRVDTIKANLINMGVQKALMAAQQKNLITDTQLKKAQKDLTDNLGKESIARRLQSWRQLSVEERKATVQEIFGSVAEDENIRREIMAPINAAAGVSDLIPTPAPSRKPIGFKQY